MHRVRPLHGNFCMFETRLVSVSVWEKKRGWHRRVKSFAKTGVAGRGGGANMSAGVRTWHYHRARRVFPPVPIFPFFLAGVMVGGRLENSFFYSFYLCSFSQEFGRRGFITITHTHTCGVVTRKSFLLSFVITGISRESWLVRPFQDLNVCLI